MRRFAAHCCYFQRIALVQVFPARTMTGALDAGRRATMDMADFVGVGLRC